MNAAPASDINKLDVDLLLAFDALLIDSNVTKAAARLNIRQPALSARLARLRDFFGDRLFIPAPTGRGVLPTPRALALQPLLSAVLANLTAMVQSTGDFDPTSSSRIFTLALHENPAVMLAPDLVPRVQALAPGVRLVLQMPDKRRMPELLENGTVDLYVGVGTQAHDAWLSRMLFEDDFVVGQRKGHPRGGGALSLDAYCACDHLLVSSEGPTFHGFVDTALAAAGKERRVAFSVQSYGVAPTIIATSDLLCTLPRRFLNRYAASLDLFEPPLTMPPTQVAAFWHPRHQDDPGHRWLRDQIFRAGASINQR
ncbi:LysR substrate-binding domain-containing protein [Nitrospirillum iridis]|uniref:DNA-binding transcriptional LysR family regulator n=1 Tax=Nitrospirillum iridis TaxID=765888 RepID=A0A7X0EDY5_9PROT|nr:DNA-binding transcriptional LysR family regulator [Nitrospirillum iridis]